MSEIKTFFRFCPECGRRFHIKVVSKTLVDMQREQQEIKRTVILNRSLPYSPYGGAPMIVQEGEPITIDIEEFQYAYKCKHCGHEWSEMHAEQQREG